MSYFSVVIPTYNRPRTLVCVLDALERQRDAPDFEVIVIDDGSTDETSGLLEAADARHRWPHLAHVTRQPNSGPGAARNRGVRLAKGKYIILLGDDTVPEPSFLWEHKRIHCEQAESPLIACVGYTGWPREWSVNPFMDYINEQGPQFGYGLVQHGDAVPFTYFYTSNLSLRRELLLQHPFDETFEAAAFEDIEAGYRLSKQGLQLHYNALAITRHHHPMSVRGFAKRQYTAGQAAAILYRRHPELGELIGVAAAGKSRLTSDSVLLALRLLASLGARSPHLASSALFLRLTQGCYLRGLKDGLCAQTATSNVE